VWSRVLRKPKREEWHEQQKLEAIRDVRRAEKELNAALWQFQEALGQEHVDYAIYSLEAAELKLDMMLRKAKKIWAESPEENRVSGK